MTYPWIPRLLAAGIVVLSLGATVLAGEPSPSPYLAPDVRWRLNPAGQLELLYDPLANGQSEYGETYTVILNDRAPKMCGDPDGTGRHTWFFTDALMIEVLPVRVQVIDHLPKIPAGESLPR